MHKNGTQSNESIKRNYKNVSLYFLLIPLINAISATISYAAVSTTPYCSVNDISSPQKKKVQNFVKQAIDTIKIKGEKTAFKEFSHPNGEFVNKNNYIFVVDINGTTLAHGANPELIGVNIKDVDPDIAGPFLKKAKAGGGWVSYVSRNPTTYANQCKISYISPLLANGQYYVGSGFYVNNFASVAR